MKLVVDSSAFAKRYVREEGSDTLNTLLGKASQLGVSIILLPEIISAMNRRRRENALSLRDYREIKTQLAKDVHDATVLQLTSEVLSCSVTMLETNVLRAMDALHVACALLWDAQLFVTSDKRQFKAATEAGLLTEFIGGAAD